MKSRFTMAFLALLYFWPGTAPEAFAVEKAGQSIGPAAVWKPDAQAIEELKTECANLTAPSRGLCFASVMKKHGASPEAMSFSALMGNAAYLKELHVLGRVDVAHVGYPFKEPEEERILLVNGFPRVIDVDDLSAIPKGQLRSDPLYVQLARQFPEISLWPAPRSGKGVVATMASPNGGARFVVAYRLLNGCYECDLLGYARFTFEFDSLGNFTRVSLKGVESQMGRKESAVDSSSEGRTDPVEVAVGKDFSINLASNATTGYRWELATPLNEAVLELVDKQYKAPQTKLIGAQGEEVWTFRGVGRGEAIIEMKYVRPWEKGAPAAKTVKITVRIH